MRFDLARSPHLATAIVVLHAAAALCAAVLVPGVKGALLGCAIVALGLRAAWVQALLRARGSVRALEVEGTALRVFLRDGRSFPADAAPRRYVSRYLVTLPLRSPAWRGGRRTLVVVPGMLAPDAFRRLRVWSLWGRIAPVAVEQRPA